MLRFRSALHVFTSTTNAITAPLKASKQSPSPLGKELTAETRNLFRPRPMGSAIYLRYRHTVAETTKATQAIAKTDKSNFSSHEAPGWGMLFTAAGGGMLLTALVTNAVMAEDLLNEPTDDIEPVTNNGATLKTQKAVSSGKISVNDDSLPSVNEAHQFHLDAVESGEFVKLFATQDSDTKELVEKIINDYAQTQNYSEADIHALRMVALDIPSLSTQEHESLPIICDRIDQYPEFNKIYQQQKDKTSLVCVGGPAAIDTAVLAALIDASGKEKQLDNITYIIRDYGESNLAYSAKQNHQRHGNALNADPNLTGHKLIGTFIDRNLRTPSMEEITDPDFRKVDLPFVSLTLQKLRIYLGNELNWLKQYVREHSGLLTEHDLNRRESTLSQDLLHYVEKVTGEKLSSNADSYLKGDSSSIHLDMSQRGKEETEAENRHLLETAGLTSHPLSEEERAALLGKEQAKNIFAATRYDGDGAMLANAQATNTKILKQMGGDYLEGTVKRVLFAEDENHQARVAGVEMEDGQFVYSSDLHLTTGYKGKFVFADPAQEQLSTLRGWTNLVKNTLGVAQPVPNQRTTVATGASATVVIKQNEATKRQIELHGTTPQYAVTNSHWTPLAYNREYLLMRITGGGTTGQETYNPAYYLNLIVNTKRIFGDNSLKAVVKVYGCPRSINARNSTEFFKAANALFSFGKGGTGNTKRHAEAALALKELQLNPGFKKNMEEFFYAYKDHTGMPLEDVIKRLHTIAKEMGFLTEDNEHFIRRLGFRQPSSRR